MQSKKLITVQLRNVRNVKKKSPLKIKQASPITLFYLFFILVSVKENQDTHTP